MPRGTVKWFDDDKGYDFIMPEDGGTDLFVHYSAIVGGGHRSLEEGAKVSYEATRGRKGMQAENVSKIPNSDSEWGVENEAVEVPLGVEAAAYILVEHFDPEELYDAMLRVAR
jgi:cold shock protein